MREKEFPVGAPVKYAPRAQDENHEVFLDAVEIYVEGDLKEEGVMAFSCRLSDGTWKRGLIGSIDNFTLVAL